VEITNNGTCHIDGCCEGEVTAHSAEERDGGLAARIIAWDEVYASKSFSFEVKGRENDNI
jgi:hypothetical protein